MSKISVYFVKTGESLDIAELAFEVLDTLVTPDGAYLAVQSGCSACAGGACRFSSETVGSGETVSGTADAAPAADAPAAN